MCLKFILFWLSGLTNIGHICKFGFVDNRSVEGHNIMCLNLISSENAAVLFNDKACQYRSNLASNCFFYIKFRIVLEEMRLCQVVRNPHFAPIM